MKISKSNWWAMGLGAIAGIIVAVFHRWHKEGVKTYAVE